MKSWCQVSQGLTFPVYDIIDVNGEKAHPLFIYLKAHAKGAFNQERILWNYTKFVVFPNEEKIKRFSPLTSIQSLTGAF